MQKEPTIKELLKEMGGIPTYLTGDLSEAPMFKELKEAIKQLRKESKRLKKDMSELQYIIDTVEFLKDILPPEKLEQIKLVNPEQIKGLLKELPVAEFKCAKTNKPSKEGVYPVIFNVKDGPMISSSKYTEKHGWEYYNPILAFTETPPEQILKALK